MKGKAAGQAPESESESKRGPNGPPKSVALEITHSEGRLIAVQVGASLRDEAVQAAGDSTARKVSCPPLMSYVHNGAAYSCALTKSWTDGSSGYLHCTYSCNRA